MKKKSVVTYIKLSKKRIELNIFLKETGEILFKDFHNFSNIMNNNEININSKIIKGLILRARNDLKIIITSAYVIYDDGLIGESYLVTKPTKIYLKSSSQEINDLIVSNTTPDTDLSFVSFVEYKKNCFNEKDCALFGNYYYDDKKTVSHIKNIFQLSGMRIIELVPISLVNRDLVNEKNFMEVNIGLESIKINIFKKGLLWKQIILTSDLVNSINILSTKLNISKEKIISDIYSNVDLNSGSINLSLYNEILNEYGVVEFEGINTSQFAVLVRNSLKKSFLEIENVVSSEKLEEYKKIIVGSLFSINGTEKFVYKNLKIRNSLIMDSYKDSEFSNFYQNIITKYIINNMKIIEVDSIFNTIKERVISLTSNHKTITPFKNFITSFSKPEWWKNTRVH